MDVHIIQKYIFSEMEQLGCFLHMSSSKERTRWDVNKRAEQTGNWVSGEQRVK